MVRRGRPESEMRRDLPTPIHGSGADAASGEQLGYTMSDRLEPAVWRLASQAALASARVLSAASEEAITAAERRLGIDFPPSYRAFLLIANGADAGGLGADSVQRLVRTDPNGLLRVEDVLSLADVAPELVPMWSDVSTLHTRLVRAAPDSARSARHRRARALPRRVASVGVRPLRRDGAPVFRRLPAASHPVGPMC